MGCGYNLILWTYWFGIFGMGFDIISDNVMYANNIAMKNNLTYLTYHAKMQSIYTDNWMPHKSFDYIFSNEVLEDDLEEYDACLLIQKSMKILKQNGTAWFSWNDKDEIKQCFLDLSIKDEHNQTMLIEHEWLNETDLLETCAGNPHRSYMLLKRVS